MPKVKTFSRGGILVDSHRDVTAHQPIRPLFLPSLAVLPLVQYPGARAEWVVAAGDVVTEDQVLARGLRPEDLPLHSPIPGRLIEFREIVLPGGDVSSAALIRLEGAFGRTGRPASPQDWSLATEADLRDRIRQAGVFLQSSPLDQRRTLDETRSGVDALVINALQPEPYVNLSAHLQQERPAALVEGVRILQRILRPAQTHFVGDPDHPEAWLREGHTHLEGVEFHALEFKYPQAQEGILLSTMGLPKSARRREATLVLDVASVLAVRDAVVEGRPQVEKAVVVAGSGVRVPGVYRVRVGTPLVQLLKDAGGLEPGDQRVLMGGPLTGQVVDHLSTPVVKSTQAVLVLGAEEINESAERPCIRCGECVQACPVGLEPVNLFKALQQGHRDWAEHEGLSLCIECGICSYVCPSRVPLVTTFHRAKTEVSRA